MEYTTLSGKLILPEYGRNIQQMVKHCQNIEDRTERTRCAKTIINIMGNLFPYLRDINDFKHKLWDHLAIMSDFKLDIDYPYEVVKADNLYIKPARIPYKISRIKYMHYGRTLEQMIDKAVTYEDGENKDALILLIANHMKKSYLTWNKEVVDDRKIIDDLRFLSDSKIDLNPDTLKLMESKDILTKKKRIIPTNNQNNRRPQNNNQWKK
ncbi:MAG: DUF4290 domain-containing protein [Prevotellaceae bacterium]|jgi:hypothetical protein|nr:DUF4290 domain-containing protein [Prevotellaceae bacterium]